ncbi:hypothetical protein ABOONEI_2490 [Aciduliprofundum boonei T469]|nr:hypothetical protein ABOONEI_2490 [Aciduliprofundum boonei T469]
MWCGNNESRIAVIFCFRVEEVPCGVETSLSSSRHNLLAPVEEVPCGVETPPAHNPKSAGCQPVEEEPNGL